MDFLLIVVSILIIITKYFDCATTSKRITGISQERNRLARGLMSRIGIKTTLWGTFILAILLVGVTLFYTMGDDSLFYKIGFIVIGLVLATIQAAVAHQNMTMRQNFITRFLLQTIIMKGK